MIPLVKSIWHDLWWHEEKAKIWFRSFLLWAGTLVGPLTIPGVNWRAWTWTEWAVRLTVAGVVGAAGLVAAGQPNKT